MGACRFLFSKKATSLNEAYKDSVENAIEEYGNDSYNGTISTTHGIIDLTSEFKKSGKRINDFITNKLEDCGKRDCYGVCIEPPVKNENKIKSVVQHTVEKGTKKWILKYMVKEGSTSSHVLKGFDTKGDAVKYAREHTEKHKITTIVEMQKILEKGDTKVAYVMYKQSSKESLGKYILFGLAAE